jgi:hypothetical protein
MRRHPTLACLFAITNRTRVNSKCGEFHAAMSGFCICQKCNHNRKRPDAR